MEGELERYRGTEMQTRVGIIDMDLRRKEEEINDLLQYINNFPVYNYSCVVDRVGFFIEVVCKRYSNAICLLHIIELPMSCKTHRLFTDLYPCEFSEDIITSTFSCYYYVRHKAETHENRRFFQHRDGIRRKCICLRVKSAES